MLFSNENTKRGFSIGSCRERKKKQRKKEIIIGSRQQQQRRRKRRKVDDDDDKKNKLSMAQTVSVQTTAKINRAASSPASNKPIGSTQ